MSKYLTKTAIIMGLLVALNSHSQSQPVELYPKVNLNTATEVELSYLPGVGPKTAQRIVAYRNRRPFRRISDIIRVKGIGRKTFRKLRPYLCVEGPTTAKQKIKLPK